MPRDATNLPFPRSAPYQKSETGAQQAAPGGNLNTTLNIENMLLEEFNYASLTAYQSMEDRARISSLYYLLLGALASGLLAIYQSGGSTHNYSQPLLVAILVLAGLLSITFFEKIVRVRAAYRESLICMNVIKEFYIKQFEQDMPHIQQAFRWRLKTIPAGESIKSVTFAISALIALMGSICLGTAVLLGLAPEVVVNPGSAGPIPYLVSAVVFLAILLVYIWYYRRSLSKNREREVIEKQAEAIGLSIPEGDE
jgi:hypothetical protein